MLSGLRESDTIARMTKNHSIRSSTALSPFRPAFRAGVATLAFMLVSACGGESEPPAAATADDMTSQQTLARETCRDAWLATLDTPERAEISPLDTWPVTRQADDTILVRLTAKIFDALDEQVEASWECVVLPDGARMRMISLIVVEI